MADMKPGWYVRREMVNTLEFWDGNRWTGRTAPDYRGIRTSVWTVAWGVALGVLLAVLVGTLLGVAGWWS